MSYSFDSDSINFTFSLLKFFFRLLCINQITVEVFLCLMNQLLYLIKGRTQYSATKICPKTTGRNIYMLLGNSVSIKENISQLLFLLYFCRFQSHLFHSIYMTSLLSFDIFKPSYPRQMFMKNVLI